MTIYTNFLRLSNANFIIRHFRFFFSLYLSPLFLGLFSSITHLLRRFIPSIYLFFIAFPSLNVCMRQQLYAIKGTFGDFRNMTINSEHGRLCKKAFVVICNLEKRQCFIASTVGWIVFLLSELCFS